MNFSLPLETPEGQAQAITANNKIITVGAGAGTGKTWVLSERYLRLLLEDESILPSNILTLTYTEAAAGDMKNRILERITRELQNFHDEERKRRILDGLADSWISTIHSFAARLIREAGLTLDIDPMASIISTQQANEFWEGIKNAAEFANFQELARAYGDKVLRKAAKFLDEDDYFSSGVSKWKAQTLSDFAKSTAELHASSGHTWQEMLAWSENDNLIAETRPIVEKILADEWRRVWEFWSKINLPEAKNPDGPGGRLINLLERQAQTPYNSEASRKFYDELVNDAEKRITANAHEPFKSLKAELGMTLGDWRKKQPELIKKITADYDNNFPEEELLMRKSLMKFCALSWGMWDIMKKRRGLLSFSDMILHAKSAISNGAVKREFAHVLVDEFQDTDRLQFEMIKSLADASSLFAVGDPKQSIYKFRHADPSLFAEIIREAEAKIELDVSFRTRNSLLQRINNLFAKLWANGLGRSEAMEGLKFKPLEPALNDSERDSGTMPDFRIILAKHNKSNTQEACKNLADTLAYKIAAWVKDKLTIWDKQAKIIRPVKFSDFAILSRSRTIYPVLEEALKQFGIKSVQDKSTDYFSRGEINDVVCMLRAAANFNDDFALSGWLISPFSGIAEQDAISQCLAFVDSNTRPIDLIRRNLPEANSRLEHLALIGEHEGPAGLLALYDKNRAWLSCYDASDRIRVLRNVRLALSVARDFQQGGTSSLVSCAEYMTRAVKNQIPFEEPAWHDENENAVKLGVVHSAKGLEYPVTVIFESRTRKNSDRGALRPSRNLGVVFSNFPDEINTDTKSKAWDWEKLLSEQGDAEEEERLFYVAATRAQDSLIFCGLIDDDKGEPHNYTWTKFLLDNIDDANYEEAKALDSSKVQALNYDKEERALNPVCIMHTRNSLRQISASSFALFEWCPFAWRRSYRQGLSLSWELPADNAEEFTGGAELGSLAHWVLARWPKSQDYMAELDYLLHDREVISLLPGYLREIWRDKKAKPELESWLKNFAVSDLGLKLRTQNNIKREYNFRLKLNNETTLAGSIDAFYGGNNILDYKITSIDNVPPGLYESQLDFYALAIHELTGAESVNTSIAFLREGKIKNRTCYIFSEIKERVENAAEICASGPYNPKYQHCGLCPFKRGCVKVAEKF